MCIMFRPLTLLMIALARTSCAVGANDATDPDRIAAALMLPEGLEATVWAQSPQFYNPTRMDTDERGRIWVSEAVNYRGYNTKKQSPLWHESGDRIVILEDADGDGKADSSKLFAQDKDLVAPLGIAVIGNKVVVSCSPNLIVYTKNEKDEVVSKDVLLTGWGGFDHDHSLHKLQAGPDGRWYLNAGNAGPHLVRDKSGWMLRAGSWYTGGSPHNTTNTPGLKSDDGRIWTGGVMVSLNPDGTGLQVLGHGMRNPYGTCVDSFGCIWMNDNDDTQSCHTAFLMRYGDCGYNSKDGSRGWGADRRPGQSIPIAHWRQEDPGVIPSGHVYGNGAPTGIAYYESGALGHAFDGGLLLSCEAGQNVVWGYLRKVQGAGFALEPFPFLRSIHVQDPNYVWHKADEDRRKWFRPTDVIVGTDGAVYVSDWFDAIVGGHAMKDTAGTGAIYRIAPKGRNCPAPKYDFGSIPGLAEATKSPAVNVRAAAAEKLSTLKGTALPAVKALLADNNRFVRARAAWLLSRLGDAGIAEVRSALKDSDDEVRSAAYCVLLQAKASAPAQVMAHDPSAAVRREVALSQRDIPFEKSREILLAIAAQYQVGDRWYLEALGTGCEGKQEDMYASFLGALGSAPLKWSDAFADIAWQLHPATATPAFKDRALSEQISTQRRRQMIDALAFIQDKNAAEAMAQIAGSGPRDLREHASWWLKHRANNDWREFRTRAKEPVTDSAEAFHALKLRKILIDPAENNSAREKAAEALSKTPEGGHILISLAEAGTLSGELKAIISETIFRNPDLSVRALASRYFPRKSAEGSAFPPLDELVKMPGNASNGRAIFASAKASCTQCHNAGDVGKEIGPDLTRIHEKYDKRAMLDAVLNPSASILVGYEAQLLITRDGRAVTGFIQADGVIVQIKAATGTVHSIPKSDISKRRQLSESLMPDNVALGLTPQELSDLVAFLLSKK